MKLWAGRFSKEADKKTNDFNSSIKTDSRMFNEDIDGSIAHASMLAAKGIISEEDCKKILAGLSDIRNDIISGELMIDPDAEESTPLSKASLPRESAMQARDSTPGAAETTRLPLT